MFDAVMQPVRAVQRLGRKCSTATQALFAQDSANSFARNERGSVAIIFALSSFVVVSMVGGAVDFGRAYSLKSKMQNALDAASLASASAYANDPNHDVQAALQQGAKFFNATMSDVPGASMNISMDEASQTVTMTATAPTKTPFLTLVGINNITLEVTSEATTTETLASSGGATAVEIAMMLDVTGSMAWDSGNGTAKISALKTAAKSFVDTLIPNTGTPKAKIALAPFAQRINLGDDYITAATGQSLTKQETTTSQCNPHTTCVQVCTGYKKGGTECNKWKDQCTTTYETCSSTSTKYLGRCTTERTGSSAFTDDNPAANRYFPATWYNNVTDAQRCSTSSQASSNLPTSTSIMPMTTNKVALKDKIEGLSTHGGTAGHLGTAWAWYLLSPEWSGVFTGTSAPKAYNTEKLKKIAVLMTDGEYNTYYASNQGDSVDQAKDQCSEMKAKGIEVYTVGFKLDSQTAIDTLSYCATDSNHAFLAENASQLDAVFKEIAYRAVPLHLAK